MNYCKTKVLFLVLVAIALFYSPVYSNEIDTSKTYYIQSAQEYGRGMRGVWDVPGNPRRYKRGQNIKVWDLPTNDRRSFDRAFRFVKVRPGVYQISNLLSSKSRLDVAGARSKNGTNIGLWDRNNNRNAQQFRVSYRGNGRWKFYTMSGRVLCLASKSSKNGSNVHIWKNHNGPWTEWVLIPRNTYRAYMPVKNNVRRPVANVRINGLTANIIYTDRFYNKAMNVGNLLRQRGMRIKYTKTKSNSYPGKLLYKPGYLNHARSIKNIIRRYVSLTPQMGKRNSYRDKQFNIWVTGNRNVRRPISKVRLRGLTANIIYTDRFYNKAMNVGNLLSQRGMRVKYTRTNNGNTYAGKLLYKNGYQNHAKSIKNLIRGYVRLTSQPGRTGSYRDKQFNIWVTRR
jgi:hypothetical protein